MTGILRTTELQSVLLCPIFNHVALTHDLFPLRRGAFGM